MLNDHCHRVSTQLQSINIIIIIKSHLLALLGAHPILHISRIWVNVKLMDLATEWDIL
jgi:hypothetical protein